MYIPSAYISRTQPLSPFVRQTVLEQLSADRKKSANKLKRSLTFLFTGAGAVAFSAVFPPAGYLALTAVALGAGSGTYGLFELRECIGKDNALKQMETAFDDKTLTLDGLYQRSKKYLQSRLLLVDKMALGCMGLVLSSAVAGLVFPPAASVMLWAAGSFLAATHGCMAVSQYRVGSRRSVALSTLGHLGAAAETEYLSAHPEHAPASPAQSLAAKPGPAFGLAVQPQQDMKATAPVPAVPSAPKP